MQFIINLLIIIFVANTSTAFAMAKAVFPDEKSLQPIPHNVYPNISGNINSTTNIAPDYQFESKNEIQQETNQKENTTNTVKTNDPNNISFIIWPIIIIVIIICFFIYRKIKISKKIT